MTRKPDQSAKLKMSVSHTPSVWLGKEQGMRKQTTQDEM